MNGNKPKLSKLNRWMVLIHWYAALIKCSLAAWCPACTHSYIHTHAHTHTHIRSKQWLNMSFSTSDDAPVFPISKTIRITALPVTNKYSLPRNDIKSTHISQHIVIVACRRVWKSLEQSSTSCHFYAFSWFIWFILRPCQHNNGYIDGQSKI